VLEHEFIGTEALVGGEEVTWRAKARLTAERRQSEEDKRSRAIASHHASRLVTAALIMSTTNRVSFTVRRPTPPSRTASSGPDSDNPSFKTPALPRHLTGANDSLSGSPLARSAASSPGGTPVSYYQHEPDSSDEEDDQLQDQLLTSFDQFAVQRCVDSSIPIHSCLNSHKLSISLNFSSSSKKRKSDNGPLVIPALQNKDWRAVARKRRGAAQFVPASAQAQTGQDGSVGGLGTKDTINSGPVLSGLQIKTKASIKIEAEQHLGDETREVKMEVEETEEQRAVRAIIAAAEGIETDESSIRVIPTPVSEADALKQDIEELPDVATLDDYARVPVSQFGAAMLRGMGWSDGPANGGRHVEPYLPQARPALLGIGAKEKEAFDDGSGKKKRNGRPERKYVPVVKKERENVEGSGSEKREASPSSRPSGSKSRRSSRSPSRRKDWSRDDRRDNHSHGSDRDRQDRRYNGSQDRERDGYRERDRDRNREKDRESDRERVYDSDRRRNGSDRDKRRDRSREPSRRQRKD
jgi:hypothetical protein